MHLCFLLHLAGSSLEELLADDDDNDDHHHPGDDNVSAAMTHRCSTPADKHRFRYFGKRKLSKETRTIDHQPITQEIINQMLPLIDYLNRDINIKQEGLFRKSGHLGRQKLLAEKLVSGENVKKELYSGLYCAHDCANVLKSLLSHLAEPILTERHYKAHCQIPDMNAESKQLQTLQLLLQLLPAKNRFLLQRLLLLLHKVALEPANKMTSDNLGTLFAPHLLMPRQMSASELKMAASDMSRMVTFMIDNVDKLFKLPEPVIRDIATYWSQMEQSSAKMLRDDVSNVCLQQQAHSHSSDPPIYTSVTFADRQASRQAATETDTQMALAQLHAHISAMPPSSKKRRLLKQFTKGSATWRATSPPGTDEKWKKTRLLGDSIKKIVTRSHHRHGSHHGLLIDNGIREQVQRPLTGNMKKTSSCCARHIDFQKSPHVHIVDVKENQDPRFSTHLVRKTKPRSLCRTLMDSAIYKQSSITPEFSLSLKNKNSLDAMSWEFSSKTRCHQRERKSPIRATPDCRFERPMAFISPITRTLNKASLMTQTNVMTPRSRAPMALVMTP